MNMSVEKFLKSNLNLNFRAKREEKFWSEYLARFEAESQRPEPDAQQARIRGQEPEAGARRTAGHDSKPRARG